MARYILLDLIFKFEVNLQTIITKNGNCLNFANNHKPSVATNLLA